MSGVGLEVLLEGLVPEIAYSGEKGVSITSLLKIVRQYHHSFNAPDQKPQGDGAEIPQDQAQDGGTDPTFTDAEMTSARWAWDWLRSRPQILINGNRRWNKLELSEVLALPEAPEPGAATDGSQPPPTVKSEKDQKPKKKLTVRPRIYACEDLVWQTLTRHGVDYKRVPVLEWKCLLGVASVKGEGILQSDLRKLVDQDKRSLPKRTDSLARKGYIAKRTIVVSRMKTSKLWLIDFAPPILENESGGLDLTPETLTKDLEPVAWHERWTGNNIDMEAFGRTFVGIIKAWGVIRYSDLRYKMGVSGKHWQMKTLAKNSQRFVDMGVLKYTAAAFPGSRKVFKDCLKFIRDPRPEEWDKFLATGKKTSQYSDNTRQREPKPNALAVYGQDNEKGSTRQKSPRIFSGWIPEKPLALSVFEVVKSAGPEGASNPQVSVATVGYAFRRYMASHLNKVAEMQQPPHLKKFQVTSRLVRTGKTSAYMFSAPYADDEGKPEASQTGDTTSPPTQTDEIVDPPEEPAPVVDDNPFGFGSIRSSAFAAEGVSLSDLNRMARKPPSTSKRKDRTIAKMEEIRQKELLGDNPPPAVERPRRGRPPKRRIVEIEEDDEDVAVEVEKTNLDPETVEDNKVTEEVSPEEPAAEEIQQLEETKQVEETPPTWKPGAYLGTPGSLNPYPRRGRPKPSIVITIYSEKLKDPNFLGAPRLAEQVEVDAQDGIEVAVEPTALPDEAPKEEQNQEVAVEEVEDDEFVADRSPPTRGRGRGRGRGGRGRGGATRGRGARKGQEYPGGPFKCETCGNTWKNDVGLKYHQTKAQVPCNPNFDPDSIFVRKRRRMSPVPPTPTAAASVASGDDDDEDGEPLTRRRRITKSTPAVIDVLRVGGTAAREKTLPKVRNAVRSVPDPKQVFRGFASMDVDDTMDLVPRARPLRARRQELVEQDSIAAATELSELDGGIQNGSLLDKSAQLAPVVESLSLPKTASMAANGVAAKYGGDYDIKVLSNGCPSQSDTIPQPSRSGPVEVLAKQPPTDAVNIGAAVDHETTTLSSTQATEPKSLDQSQGTDAQMSHPENIEPETQLVHRKEAEKAFVARERRSSVQQSSHEYYGNVGETHGALDQDSVIKPFVPSSNYNLMATEAKRKAAQAYDIINYLLDNNCGVFPGDKALFYAMIKVFLKEFRGSIPPTWKNWQAAVRAIETRNLARVHTHMLRTETGKLATLSLVIRAGVDPMSMVPNFMKKKMKDTYPTLYIPPAFSPTKEELEFLQELDGKPVLPTAQKSNKPNANGEKFRSRRRIDEVEVFNAPYYTQTANENVVEYRDPAWDRGKNGHLPPGFPKRQLEEGDDERAQKRLKYDQDGYEDRRDAEEGGAPAIDPKLADQSVASQDGGSGAQNLGAPFGAKRRRYKKRAAADPKPKSSTQSMTPGTNLWKSGSPSVLEAIKVYGLLPARPKRGRPRIHPGPRKMTKIAPHLGRIRNPGLDSLPKSFFVVPGGADTFTGHGRRGGKKAETGKRTVKRVSFTPINDSELQTWPWVDESPSSFKVDDNLADREYGKFCEYVERCSAWEVSSAGTAAATDTKMTPGKSSINFSPPVYKCNMRSVNLKWSDDRSFTLETLPYQDLEEIAGDDDYIPVDNNPHPEPRRPPKKRRVGTIPTRRTGVGGRPTKFKLQALKTGRELTPYPTSAKDFLREPGKNDELDLDWTSENVKLTAFIVVSTLLGGVDRVVDWGLMMRLFPDMTISQLRHTWCALKKDRQSTIASLTDKFRSSFLKAYAAGELPQIDFNNTMAYDWKSLIKWTTTLDGFERVTLPASRKTLEKKFVMPNCRFENREWRESYYHPQRSVFNKFQDACSEPLSFPADEEDKNSSGKSSADLNLTVAMSWTRSLCVTPVDLYTTERILRKRNNLLPGLSRSEITDVILQGIDQLQREGIISKSTAKWSNGRRWRFNNRVPETLDKICHEGKLDQAVAFKDELDAAFRPTSPSDVMTKKKKRVTYVTRDGMIMTLINLQAQGRVRIETTGQPNVPMGHEPGNYETRKYTKKYLHFRLDIYPTDRYLLNEDDEINQLRRRLEDAPPPTRGPGGATPAWCDVFERVDVPRWLKYLSMVLNTIASRGAMRPEELAKTLKPVVMVFEVEMILEWGRELGILGAQIEIDDGQGGKKMGTTALAALEWWWFAVDAQRRRGLRVGLGQEVVDGDDEEAGGGVAGADLKQSTPKDLAIPIPRARKPLPSARRTKGETADPYGLGFGNGAGW